MGNLFPGMAGAAIGAASKTASSQLQITLLEQTKTLTESALQVGKVAMAARSKVTHCPTAPYS